jgi:RNA polymerase sigma-70 factor, ECF subfamily
MTGASTPLAKKFSFVLHLFAFANHPRFVMASARQNTGNEQAQSGAHVGISMQREGSTATALAPEVSAALSRARQGDQAAFAALVRVHQAMVFSIARNFLRDRQVAEEVAQDVFLHLYRNLASIESEAHLKFWLRKVTGHRCIDYARRNKLQTVEWEAVSEPAAPVKAGDVLLKELLRRFVATLPETPRLIVTLRYQEDLDPT